MNFSSWNKLCGLSGKMIVESGARGSLEGVRGKMAQLDKRSFKYRRLVGLMKLTAAVSRTPLAVDGQHQSRITGYARTASRWARMGRWWPELVLLLYIVCNIHIIVYLYYKYEYDFAMFELDQMKRKSNGTSFTGVQLEAMQNISKRIRQASASIGSIGGDMNEESFIYQQVCCIVLIAGLYYYLYYMLYYRLPSYFHCNSLQDLLDYEREQAKARDMVESLVKEIHQSRKLYYQCLWQRARLGRNKLAHHLYASEFQSPLNRVNFLTCCSQSDKSSAGQQLLRGQLIVKLSEARRELDELRDSGALWPINKTTEWIERRLKLQFAIFYPLILYCLSFIIIAIVIPSLFRTPQQPVGLEASDHWTPSSKMVNNSLIVTIIIIIFPATLYWGNLTVTEIDSINSINKLTSMVQECRRTNCLLLLGRGHLREEARERANKNLVLVIIQYKIAVLQFGASISESLQPFVGQIMMAALIPLQVVLHRPYVDPTGENVFISLMWVSYSIPSNMSIYPTCLLFSKCQQLFIGMTRLLAHTVEVNERLGDIYDEHTVSILRKELYNPHQALKRFESSVFGISCTNKTFCYWHFWLGIMLIVGFAGKHSSNSQMLQLLVF